jgi:predicted nucleotidyltransferase component of viral defense system
MNNLLDEMIKAYDVQSVYDKRNAVKEVIQEITLCGLSRSGFFKQAAFYGGTALRIFYGLNRFSEDLDFSLLNKNDQFTLESYLPVLEKEVRSFGLNVKIEKKNKTKDSPIHSAFIKGSTKEHLLLFYPEDSMVSDIHSKEVIKIKFEIDVNPPAFATFEKKYRLLPAPYEVKIYDEASLFAGKIHAVVGRSWQNRVKGRDLYDYVFYLSKRAPVNLKHLQERLIQSGHLETNETFSLAILKQMLKDRFEKINYEQAKEDVVPFIKDARELDIWSADFFAQITDSLQAKE